MLRYEVAWAEGPQRWNVFTPAGESIATVTFPRTIAPDCEYWCSDLLDIGENYVLLARPNRHTGCRRSTFTGSRSASSCPRSS